MKKRLTLEEIFANDELGLLEVKPKNSNSITADERLIASFQEINDFLSKNNREPEVGTDIQEHRLAIRLKSIRSDEGKKEALAEFDEFNLLGVSIKSIDSIDDVFDADDLDILGDNDEDLFDIKHVPNMKERASADNIAHRKACKDFDKYEDMFKVCQADLKAGKRKLLPFNSEKQVQEKRFFVLNGMLLYIDHIEETYVNKYGKLNGRQRCVFENGTESGMLLRSLVQRLYENGRAVSDNKETDEKQILENFSGITEEDTNTGFIYVLKSKSQNEKIQSIENLFKIGFSSTPVEKRIANAEKDPTYLMAPVSIVTTFECYNFNPQKLEQLLHNFFGKSCLNIDIFDEKGQRNTPREWFIAPLNVIEKAIALIISGGIVNYRYDSNSEEIILR